MTKTLVIRNGTSEYDINDDDLAEELLESGLLVLCDAQGNPIKEVFVPAAPVGEDDDDNDLEADDDDDDDEPDITYTIAVKDCYSLKDIEDLFLST